MTAAATLNSSGSDSYSYETENRLAATGAGFQIGYEPAGGQALILYKSGISDTRLNWSGDRMISEIDASSGWTLARRYVPGPGTDEPVVWYEGSGTSDRRWLVADERGSVVAVSNGAGTNTINRYDEYGIPASTNTGRFQYTGQAWLPDLGMYYYKARIYSPSLGRFMQTDPIGYGDGMNLYNYVGGDPVNQTDPLGLSAGCVARAGSRIQDCSVRNAARSFLGDATQAEYAGQLDAIVNKIYGLSGDNFADDVVIKSHAWRDPVPFWKRACIAIGLCVGDPGLNEHPDKRQLGLDDPQQPTERPARKQESKPAPKATPTPKPAPQKPKVKVKIKFPSWLPPVFILPEQLYQMECSFPIEPIPEKCLIA